MSHIIIVKGSAFQLAMRGKAEKIFTRPIVIFTCHMRQVRDDFDLVDICFLLAMASR